MPVEMGRRVMGRLIMAIDPGPTQSAFVLFDGDLQTVLDVAIQPNDEVLADVIEAARDGVQHLVVEQVEHYGMAVGADVFETVWWSGRFHEAWSAERVEGWEGAGELPSAAERLPRRAVKLHLCGQPRAKDAHIRQALLDRFGGIEGKAKAVGTKKDPGPLYGVRSHAWAALAVAVTWWDQQREGGDE